MKRFKNFSLLLMAVLVSFTLASCGGGGGEPPIQVGGDGMAQLT